MKKMIKYIYLKLKYLKNKTTLKSYDVSLNTKMGKYCLIGKNTKIDCNVIVGDFTYFNSEYHWIMIESNTKIGKFCSIAPGVTIGLGNHNYNNVTTHPFLYNKYYLKKLTSKDIMLHQDGLLDQNKTTIIGNDVWIGMNANIKRGVTVGNGAIIAMGSIVTKDVPPYAIVAGVPAKIIKYRFSEEDINFLQSHEWWNWDQSYLLKNYDKLYDISELKKIADILESEL